MANTEFLMLVSEAVGWIEARGNVGLAERIRESLCTPDTETSKTKIVWHPYPKERDKVKPDQCYFVTLTNGKVIVTLSTYPDYGYHDVFGNCFDAVVAFREIELPEPYRPEVEE